MLIIMRRYKKVDPFCIKSYSDFIITPSHTARDCRKQFISHVYKTTGRPITPIPPAIKWIFHMWEVFFHRRGICCINL